MNKPTVIFLGTPEFSVPVLESLITNFNVIAVFSQPDKRVGRKQILTPSPVKVYALNNNIDVYTPYKISEDTELIQNLKPDFIITCAYGQIIPLSILDIPKYYPLNVHASLLPKYRGAAPIQRAIMNGDTKSGISIMEMEEGLDTGGVFKLEEVLITKEDGFKTLSDKLSIVGSKLIVETVNEIINNHLKPIPQSNKLATYAAKITKEDELIDFCNNTLTIFNQIRALGSGAISESLQMKVYESDYEVIKHDNNPGEITEVTKKYLKIATIDGYLLVSSLQLFGKKRITAAEYYNQNASQKH